MDTDLWLFIHHGIQSFILQSLISFKGWDIHDKFVSDPKVPELVAYYWFILDYT